MLANNRGIICPHIWDMWDFNFNHFFKPWLTFIPFATWFFFFFLACKTLSKGATVKQFIKRKKHMHKVKTRHESNYKVSHFQTGVHGWRKSAAFTVYMLLAALNNYKNNRSVVDSEAV